MARILICSSAIKVYDSWAYRMMDVTRECISCILELREMLLSFQTGFNLVIAAVVCAVLESIYALESSSDTTQFLKRKESGSGSNRGPSAYQHSALTLSHTGSHSPTARSSAFLTDLSPCSYWQMSIANERPHTNTPPQTVNKVWTKQGCVLFFFSFFKQR